MLSRCTRWTLFVVESAHMSCTAVTTRCVVAELEALELVGAAHVARRFQQRRCSHTAGGGVSATECILSLIGQSAFSIYSEVSCLTQAMCASCRGGQSPPLLRGLSGPRAEEEAEENARCVCHRHCLISASERQSSPNLVKKMERLLKSQQEQQQHACIPPLPTQPVLNFNNDESDRLHAARMVTSVQ